MPRYLWYQRVCVASVGIAVGEKFHLYCWSHPRLRLAEDSPRRRPVTRKITMVRPLLDFNAHLLRLVDRPVCH